MEEGRREAEGGEFTSRCLLFVRSSPEEGFFPPLSLLFWYYKEEPRRRQGRRAPPPSKHKAGTGARWVLTFAVSNTRLRCGPPVRAHKQANYKTHCGDVFRRRRSNAPPPMMAAICRAGDRLKRESGDGRDLIVISERIIVINGSRSMASPGGCALHKRQ